MLWVTWSIPPLVSSLVLVLVVCAFWAAKSQIRRLGLLPVLAALVCALSLAPERTTAVSETLFAVISAIVTDPHLDGFVRSHVNMIVAGAALVWLLRRALQTLWKPVPELISILGVEVPVSPDVSLTAIGVDKATITWTRPPPNRPVEKYVIQVNGVNVGESATSQDTFITVSGLKPNHFYNVRIIAVGSNNFQAGSRVLRLCTFGSDGRPRLGAQRLPSDFNDTATSPRQHDAATSDDSSTAEKHFITSTFGVAHPLPADDQPTLSRDGNSSTTLTPSSRRNTVNRRHSPSTTSLDLQQLQQLQQQQQRRQSNPTAPGTATGDEDAEVTEEQMAELNKRYLNLRKETEDTITANAKEEEDMKRLLEELEAEKQEKRKEHKRKEEQTEKLKREQGATERTMRATLQRRAQKEKKLKEKTDELRRLEDNIEKWDESIKTMREDQLSYDKKKLDLEEELQKKGAELREHNAKVLAESVQLEADLKEKRRQVKKLEDERNTMDSSGDDAELRATIVELRKRGNRQELIYRDSIRHEHLRQQGLDAHLNVLAKQMQQIPQANMRLYSPPGTMPGAVPGTLPGAMPGVLSSAGLPGPIPGALPGPMPGSMPGGLLGTLSPGSTVPGASPGPVNASNMSLATGFELDPSALQSHTKRRSHTSNSLSSPATASPLPSFAVTDSNGRPPSSSTPPFSIPTRPPTQTGFLTGPFMGSSADHPGFDDAELSKTLTAGAPLSPSATSLLPSKLFSDDDPPSPSPDPSGRNPFSSMGARFSDLPNTGYTGDSSSSSKSASNSNAADASSTAGGNGFANGYGSGNDNGNGNGNASKDPQSPTPSSRSASMFSSPWSSSQNLPFPTYGVDPMDGTVSQRNGLPSPTGDPAALSRQPTNSRGFNVFFSLTRSRGTKAPDDDSPALGSLKHGQSQSFPRQGDDADGGKSRRKSLSTLNMFNRNSGGPELVDGQLLSAAGGLNNRSGGFSARNLFPFGSRPSASAFSSHAPSSPRPASTASIDLPRPSTDSGSIWGPPGENGTTLSGLGKTSRLWSTDTAWPSRNPSRRPSIHGSTPVLKTNLASADDEILDEEELLNPETSPSQVGVIGSRPPAAGKKPSGLSKTLNPAAPTFMGNLFRPRTDKDKEKGKDKDKDKDQEGEKEKPKAKEKSKTKTKGRQKDQKDQKEKDHEAAMLQTPTGPGALTLTVDEAQVSDVRISRDGYSMHTQTSMSESRDSLDYVVSNTTSEPTGGSSVLLSSSKDSGDNTLLKLFRKESTSKLSFSRRIGRSKGATGSMASSDKNMSAGRSSFGDLEDLADESVLSTSGSRGTGVGMEAHDSLGSFGSFGSFGSVGGGGSGSIASSPLLGPSKSRDNKGDGKLKPSGSWFSIKKKNRERPSLDMERPEREHRGLGEPDSTASSLATVSSKGTETSEK